jgi:hypothetical protein
MDNTDSGASTVTAVAVRSLAKWKKRNRSTVKAAPIADLRAAVIALE